MKLALRSGFRMGRHAYQMAQVWDAVHTLKLGESLCHAMPERWHGYRRIDIDAYMLTSGKWPDSPRSRGLRADLIKVDYYDWKEQPK